MKEMLKKKGLSGCFLFFVLLCFPAVSPAANGDVSWSDDMRITYTYQQDWLPSMILDNNEDIYLVWAEGGGHSGWYSNNYFTKLDRDGNTLINKTLLYLPGGQSDTSLIVDSDNTLHIAFHGPGERISHRAVDSSGNISPYRYINKTSGSNTDIPMMVIDSQEKIHLLFQNEQYDPYQGDWNRRRDLFYQSFTWDGSVLNDVAGPIELTTDGGTGYPNVGYVNNLGNAAIDSNDNIHVVWADWRGYSNYNVTEIYYKKIDSNGSALTGEIRLTAVDGNASAQPTVAVDSENNVHIVWVDSRDSGRSVYYKKLDNNGNVLIDEVKIVSDPSLSLFYSMVMDKKDNLHLIWQGTKDSGWEVYYSVFDKNGLQVISDQRVTESSGNALVDYFSHPQIAVDSQDRIHIAWVDTRNGYYELYYKYGDLSLNEPPVAHAGPDQIIECASYEGATVMLDGSGSSDADGDSLTYRWTGPFSEGNGEVTGMSPAVTLPLGTHEITLVVNDGKEDSEADTVSVTVRDTTAPLVELSVSPDLLWPPNHKYVNIASSVTITDVCDANPSITAMNVSSNEPDDATGDGHFINDILIDNGQLSLRAERDGAGTGRLYSIFYFVSDESGNSATAVRSVQVPFNKGKK